MHSAAAPSMTAMRTSAETTEAMRLTVVATGLPEVLHPAEPAAIALPRLEARAEPSAASAAVERLADIRLVEEPASAAADTLAVAAGTVEAGAKSDDHQ